MPMYLKNSTKIDPRSVLNTKRFIKVNPVINPTRKAKTIDILYVKKISRIILEVTLARAAHPPPTIKI